MRIFYYCNIGHGFWFRFFGYGLWVKQTKYHQPLFRERNGYTKSYRLFGLTFKFLAKVRGEK
jgi:hypothetical protein